MNGSIAQCRQKRRYRVTAASLPKNRRAHFSHEWVAIMPQMFDQNNFNVTTLRPLQT